MACCSFRRWEECALEMVQNKCGDSGHNAFKAFIDKMFANLPDLICVKQFYIPSADHCKKFDGLDFDRITLKDIESMSKINSLKLFSFLIQFEE